MCREKRWTDLPTIIAEGPMRASLENVTEETIITTPEGRTLGVFTPKRANSETEAGSGTVNGSPADDALSRMNE